MSAKTVTQIDALRNLRNEGLEVTGLATIITRITHHLTFFQTWRSKKVNVAKLKSLLTPKFSEIGSNALLKEMEVYGLFNNYF